MLRPLMYWIVSTNTQGTFRPSCTYVHRPFASLAEADAALARMELNLNSRDKYIIYS